MRAPTSLSAVFLFLFLGGSQLLAQVLEVPQEEDPPGPRSGSTDIPAEASARSEETEDGEDAARTVRLTVKTDAPCRLWVAGQERGLVDAERFLVTEIPVGSVNLRAVSTKTPGAVWTRKVETEEDIEITIKMAKKVRERHRLERREKVYPEFESALMWSREDNRRNVTWKAAGDFCERSSLGGWENWRLPTIEELHSLQAKWSQQSFKIAGPIGLSACCPWSSTEIDEKSAWNFNFRFRRRFEGKKDYSFGLRALCVRYLSVGELQRQDEAMAAKKKRGAKKKKEDASADEEGSQ